MPHRTRRHRPPLPARARESGVLVAGGSLPAVRPQPRHRRSRRSPRSEWSPRPTPCITAPAGLAADSSVGRPTVSRRRARTRSATRLTSRRRAPARPSPGRTGTSHPAGAARVVGCAGQPHRLDERARLHHQHGQPVLGPEVQPVVAHRLGGPDVQVLDRRSARRGFEPTRQQRLSRRPGSRCDRRRCRRRPARAGRGARAAPVRHGCARPSGTTGTRSAATSNRFSPIPPLRSSTVCRPSSSACTAALHSLSAGVLMASCPRAGRGPRAGAAAGWSSAAGVAAAARPAVGWWWP